MAHVKFIGQKPTVELRFPWHSDFYLFEGPDHIACMDDADAADLLTRGNDFVVVPDPEDDLSWPKAEEQEEAQAIEVEPEAQEQKEAKPKRKYTRKNKAK